jgi:hypothetical protein
LTRPGRIGALLAGALALLVIALGLSIWLTESPGDRQARLGPPPDSIISVAVRERRLARSIDLSCETGATAGFDAPVGVDPGVGEPVVTALPVAEGGLLEEGDLALEVSGRPIIVVGGRIPAYRDIRTGDSGPDVLQLESAMARLGLIAVPDTVADRSTRAAVASLYASLGYSVPDGGRLVASRHELVPVPTLPGRLRLGSLAVGTPAPADATFSIGGSGVVVRCVVDQADLPELRQADSISITTPSGRSAPARLSGVTRPGRGGAQDGETAGVVAVLRPERPVALDRGVFLTAKAVVARAPERGTVVPLTALWRTASGRDVVTVVDGDTLRQVPVTVGFGDGLSVRVDARDGSLNAGDRVRVGEGLGR